MPHKQHSSHRAIVAPYYLAAVCSGAAALIYQIVWSKSLSLTFGSTTQGAAAVIAAFMIGMGLGARAVGGWRTAGSPGRVYVYLEIAIAVCGVVSAPVLTWFSQTTVQFVNSGALVRFVTAMAILIIPAMLMGATFPALCRTVIATNNELRERLGAVYGYNTIGAAVGALAAGFVLIEWFGGRGTAWIGAGLNSAAAIIVIISSRTALASHPTEAPHQRTSQTQELIPDWALIAVAFASGLATLAFEIVWFRAAKYLIGNSTYAMSMVLAVFLVGLGLGGLYERRLARRGTLESDLVFVQAAIALVAMLSAALLYAALNWDPLRTELSIYAEAMMTRPWPVRLLWSLGTTCILLGPPTVLMGLTFPMVITLFTRSVERMGFGIGTVYLMSNIGATTGAIVGALLVLPVLGTMGGLKAIAALNLGIAALIGVYVIKNQRRKVYTVTAIAVLTLVLAASLPRRLDFRGELEGGTSRVIFAEEGDLATVKVTLAANNIWKAMTIDGYAIGVDRSLPRDITFKQLLLAHLPLVLHPEAKSVLNIGLGSATTQASLASYDNWERMECIEISQSVVKAARLFEDGRSLDDPRLRLHVTDAVQFLRGDGPTYDVIVADGKQNPQFPGNSALLSRELFESAKSRLADNGIMVQWIPLGFPPRAFDVMANTFASVFEEMSVYYFPPEALIVVGGRSSIPSMSGSSASARFLEDLAPYLIDSPDRMISGWLTDGRGLRTVLQGTAVNTWDHPVLEFWPYRDFDFRRAGNDKGRNLALLERAREKSREPNVAGAVSVYLDQAGYVRRGYTLLYESGRGMELGIRLDSGLAKYPDDPLLRGFRERFLQGPAAVMHSGPLY